MKHTNLFRGKTLETHEWIYGGFYSSGARCFIIKPIKDNPDEWGALEVDPETIGRWTGLNDYNGTPVYENDFVWMTHNNEFAEVVWSKANARFIMEWKGMCADFNDIEFEVVGNIHDDDRSRSLLMVKFITRERDTNGRL